jgi:hypothetical protein
VVTFVKVTSPLTDGLGRDLPNTAGPPTWIISPRTVPTTPLVAEVPASTATPIPITTSKDVTHEAIVRTNASVAPLGASVRARLTNFDSVPAINARYDGHADWYDETFRGVVYAEDAGAVCNLLGPATTVIPSHCSQG